MKNQVETTKKQQKVIDMLTKKYGMNEERSEHESDTDGTSFYTFKTAYGSGQFAIQRDGKYICQS